MICVPTTIEGARFCLFSCRPGLILRASQAVPHRNNDRALRRLTSEVRRDPVYSTRCDRQPLDLNMFEATASDSAEDPWQAVVCFISHARRRRAQVLHTWFRAPSPPPTPDRRCVSLCHLCFVVLSHARTHARTYTHRYRHRHSFTNTHTRTHAHAHTPHCLRKSHITHSSPTSGFKTVLISARTSCTSE